MAKICCTILNWNGWQDTCDCLASLLESIHIPNTIIVVDNGSSDNSVHQITTWAKKHFPLVAMLDGSTNSLSYKLDEPAPFVLITNKHNLGFAAGNNPALSWALSQKGFDYIWLLNNDTIVRPDTANNLLTYAENNGSGIVGATVVFADPPHTIQCAGGCSYNFLTTIFTPLMAGSTLEQAITCNNQVPIDYIYGASMFIRSEIFETCGLLNEDYFLFYEEIDFCRRAEQKSYTLHWCRDAIVLHKGSQSVGRPDKATRRQLLNANYHENLSTLIFQWNFHKLSFPFSFTFRLLGKLTIILTQKKYFLIPPLFKAYRDFINGLTHGKRWNKAIQRNKS